MSPLLRVVLAEDHPLMRTAITYLLSPHCVLAGAVERGDAIVRTVEDLRPDAVVMDVSMPGRSGLQVLSELRVEYPDLAIILLTNHDSKAYVDAARERGADGYILKRDAATTLWMTLEASVNRRRALSSKQRVSG